MKRTILLISLMLFLAISLTAINCAATSKFEGVTLKFAYDMPLKIAPTKGWHWWAEELEKRTPKMIAPMVVYLATDEAQDITGKNFSIIGNEIGIFSDRDVFSRVYKTDMWTVDELIEIIPKTLVKIK